MILIMATIASMAAAVVTRAIVVAKVVTHALNVHLLLYAVFCNTFCHHTAQGTKHVH